MIVNDSQDGLNLLGIQFSLYDKHQLLDAIHNSILAGDQISVLSGNVQGFNLAYRQFWLRQFYNQADVIRLDGVGVRIGLWVLGHQTPERMTWADFAWDLAEFAVRENFTFFFLGARPGVAEKAADRLRASYVDLRIVGVHHGFFNKDSESKENEVVIEEINLAKPEILIVGFGMPLQERWLIENRSKIDAPVVLTGGAVFDYLSGELKRAPRWMTDNGLEWLGRLLIEPSRLWKRYLLGNPLFIMRVLKQKIGLLNFMDQD